MNPRELRIGNHTKQGTIISFYEGGVHVGYGKLYEFNKLEPVPLTEEWLLKFGFVCSKLGNAIWKSIPQIKAEIHFEPFRGGLVCVVYSSTGSVIPNDIQYVHQLQNLYWCLVGEELTLKETK